MLSNIKVIGFDADDTLWDNEPFYREAEHEFCILLKDFMCEDELNKELFSTEIGNLNLYGYGIKAFTLSLIETAIRITKGKVDAQIINGIVEIGKTMLRKPVTLLNGVEGVLKQLKPHYKLIIATKGDLLDQERKLRKSNLAHYFHHIEVMTEKQTCNYINLLSHLDIKPEELFMVGNSLKSDVLPIIELGGFGAFVPYFTTWQHEYVDVNSVENDHLFKLNKITELPKLLGLGL